jgi:hypothetical protein
MIASKVTIRNQDCLNPFKTLLPLSHCLDLAEEIMSIPTQSPNQFPGKCEKKKSHKINHNGH